MSDLRSEVAALVATWGMKYANTIPVVIALREMDAILSRHPAQRNWSENDLPATSAGQVDDLKSEKMDTDHVLTGYDQQPESACTRAAYPSRGVAPSVSDDRDGTRRLTPNCWHKNINSDGFCIDCGSRAAIKLDVSRYPVDPDAGRAPQEEGEKNDY